MNVNFHKYIQDG